MFHVPHYSHALCRPDGLPVCLPSASSAISLIVKQQRQQQTSNTLPKPTEQQAATEI